MIDPVARPAVLSAYNFITTPGDPFLTDVGSTPFMMWLNGDIKADLEQSKAGRFYR